MGFGVSQESTQGSEESAQCAKENAQGSGENALCCSEGVNQASQQGSHQAQCPKPAAPQPLPIGKYLNYMYVEVPQPERNLLFLLGSPGCEL